LVALYAQVGEERVGRVFVPVLGAVWLVLGLFGLAVSLLGR